MCNPGLSEISGMMSDLWEFIKAHLEKRDWEAAIADADLIGSKWDSYLMYDFLIAVINEMELREKPPNKDPIDRICRSAKERRKRREEK